MIISLSSIFLKNTQLQGGVFEKVCYNNFGKYWDRNILIKNYNLATCNLGGVMKDKVVCFAGHRHDFRNVGIENRLEKVIIGLIKKGYNTFFDGDKGAFDKISASIVIRLKEKYPHIKIYRILTYYHSDNKKWGLPACYDGSIMPEIEWCYHKIKITKRNEWIVDNSDILVCHIVETYKSGAYNTLRYAQKTNKKIICI